MQVPGNTKSGLPFTIAVDRQGRLVAGMSASELQAAALKHAGRHSTTPP